MLGVERKRQGKGPAFIKGTSQDQFPSTDIVGQVQLDTGRTSGGRKEDLI